MSERLKTITYGVKDRFIGDTRIPPHLINKTTVAYLIWDQARNPTKSNLPGEVPFSITSLMTDAGYNPQTYKPTYGLGDPYPSFRSALHGLYLAKILNVKKTKESDIYGETEFYYIPTDETGDQRQRSLEELAQGAEQISKRFKMISQQLTSNSFTLEAGEVL